MKKIYLPLLSVATLFFSCTSEHSSDYGTTGSIKLRSSLNLLTEETSRAETLTDLSGYKMTLNGEETAVPTDGIISDLVPGSYNIMLTNLDEGFVPAFEDPRYSGIAEATVSSGNTTPVTIELKQANAGVFFVYDNSLSTLGLEGVIPAVSDASNTLDYSLNREARGYFLPGELAITFSNEGEPVMIGSEPTRHITVTSEQLWKITLRAGEEGDGSLSLDISIEVITTPTHEEEWQLDVEQSAGLLTIAGLPYTELLIETESGNVTVTTDGEGKSSLTELGSAIIYRISGSGIDPILIGRKASENISLIYNDGITVRESAEGNLIGTIAEMLLIKANSANLGASYIQQADIYLDQMNWPIIGDSYSAPFTGSYDGAGYKIHNLTITSIDTNLGLFGICTDAKIRNVTIASGSVSGTDWVAAIAGRISGNNGLIENCENHASVSGGSHVGGITSWNAVARISDCRNYGNITGNEETLGGIVGTQMGMGAIIEGSVNYGLIEGRLTAGGICGDSQSGCVVQDCINHGEIRSQIRSGGILGQTRGEVRNCHNHGTIICTINNAGGIIGTNFGTLNSCVNSGTVNNENPDGRYTGGIAGSNFEGNIYGSTNTAQATIGGGEQMVGGITGYSYRGTIQDCANHADLLLTVNSVGGLVGDNRGNVYTSSNYGKVRGTDMVGGICGRNELRIRMCENHGSVNGNSIVGGIVGYNLATSSGSINRGEVTAAGDFAGGINAITESNTVHIVACYNVAPVSGNNYVGGVTGCMDLDALVDASYNTGSVTGAGWVAGVCGAIMDEYSTLNSSYWTGMITQGIGSGEGEVFYFDDGTLTFGGVELGWPEESHEYWGINPEGGSGTEGNWWAHHGTRGTTHYPALWWE